MFRIMRYPPNRFFGGPVVPPRRFLSAAAAVDVTVISVISSGLSADSRDAFLLQGGAEVVVA